jgi:hypothetical protein
LVFNPGARGFNPSAPGFNPIAPGFNPNGLDFAGSGKIPYAGDFVTSVFLPGSASPFPVIAKSAAMKQSGDAYFRIASLLRAAMTIPL